MIFKRTCVVCRTAFQHDWCGRGPLKIVCSKRCANRRFKSKNGHIYSTHCTQCDASLPKGKWRYCSPGCYKKGQLEKLHINYQRKRTEVIPEYGTCHFCATPFAMGPRSKYCSADCMIADKRLRDRAAKQLPERRARTNARRRFLYFDPKRREREHKRRSSSHYLAARAKYEAAHPQRRQAERLRSKRRKLQAHIDRWGVTPDQPHELTCTSCASTFIVPQFTIRRLCDKCRKDRAHARRPSSPPILSKKCKGCHTIFTPKSNHRNDLYCSIKCHKQYLVKVKRAEQAVAELFLENKSSPAKRSAEERARNRLRDYARDRTSTRKAKRAARKARRIKLKRAALQAAIDLGLITKL
jgi:hypothetical protein